MPRKIIRGAIATLFPPLAILVAYLARGHIGTAYDSATYAVAARSFARGLGYLAADGTHLTMFPPGYSAALAAVSISMPHETAALVINLAGAAMVGYVTHCLTQGTPAALALAAILLLTFNPALWSVGNHMGSEMLGIALLMSAVLAHVTSLSQPESRAAVVVAGTLAGLAGITRTALVFTVVALLLGYALRARWVAALISAAIGAGMPLAWAAYNAMAHGSAAGRRLPPEDDPREVLAQLARGTASWFSPTDVSANKVALAAGILAAGAAAALAVAAVRTQVGLIAVLNLLAIGGGTAVAKLLTAMDSLEGRLLAPLAPLLAVAIVHGAGIVRRRWIRNTLIVCVAAGCLLGAARSVTIPARQAWPSTECAAIPPGGTLLSDAPSIVAWHCDRLVGDSPRRVYYATDTPATEDSERTSAAVAAGCVRVAWTGGDTASYRFGPADLHAIYGFTRVHVGTTTTVMQSHLCA